MISPDGGRWCSGNAGQEGSRVWPTTWTETHRSGSRSAAHGWVDRRFLGVGAGSGFLGGICCAGSAAAVGLGLSGLSFFGAWMEHYQVYFIAASAAVMILWLARVARPYGFSREGMRQAGRALGKHALVMGIVYAATLGVSMGAYLGFRE